MDDSPERTIMALAQAQSPITQDSPFFNYLNNLSPINLVKSAHVAQTFSELNFPPPPAVFTSPRVSCSKESSFMKRPSQRDIEDKEIKMPGMESDKVNNSDMNMSSSNTVNPLDHAGKEIAFDSSPGEKTIGEDKGVGTFSGCSPSQYLSDPADEQNNGDTTSKVNADSLFPLEMMQQHSSQDAALCNTIKRMDLDSDSKTSEEFALSSYEVTETDGSIQIVPESISFLDGTEQINAEQAISKDFGAASSGIDSDGNAPNFNNKDKSLKASSAHAQDFVSQKVSSFASVLSKDSACNPSAWQNVSSVEHSGALIQQGLKDLKNQYEVTSQSNDIDTTPQPLHDSFQDQHGCSDIPRKVDNEQTRPTEHQASFACKPCGQIQRGAVRRRCLDFEATESQNKLMSRSLKSLNAPSSGSTSVTSCMPSRIGLHLNSLASTMSMNPVPSILASGKGPVSVQGLLPLTRSKENPSDVVGSSQPPVSSGGTLLAGSNPTGSSGMMLSLLEKGRGDQQEMQPSATQISVSKTTNSMRSLSVGVKPIQGRLPLKPEEGNLSPQGKKRPLSQDFSRQASVSASDEASQGSQGSPRKKRKSAAGGDKEGCKRCHCKKSKCLKLYCECFAAGVYCVEPCTCHDCHNKPEYEDLVLSTRQQIESRNPLAFAPKIICDTDSPPNTGDEVGETPSTARHKKGCNCKKSLCNKKYCECFQAGVACSDGCRCEGCMNGFGKKEGGYDDTGEKAHPEAGERESSEEKVELHDSATDNLSLDQQHANDLTPITPSVQSLSQGRSMVKTKPSVKKPSVSEDVESSASQSCAKPPKSPGRALRPIKGQQKNSVLGTFSQLGSRCSAPSIFTPKMEKSDQVCPKWDGSSDISSVTPMLHHPLPLRAASADGKEASLTSGQKTDIPCLRVRSLAPLHNSNGNTSPLFQNPTLRTPLCLTDSNRWQSPMSGHVTPSTPSLTRLGYNAASKSGGGSGDVDMPPVESSATAEDDTPEILKTTCSPPRVFKASSPNQKRVSPPHGCFGKEMNKEFLSSSPGLRSGRKIILQSVSSFPPLTPVANEDQGKD